MYLASCNTSQTSKETHDDCEIRTHVPNPQTPWHRRYKIKKQLKISKQSGTPYNGQDSLKSLLNRDYRYMHQKNYLTLLEPVSGSICL